MSTVVSPLTLENFQDSLQDQRCYAYCNCVQGRFLLHHWSQIFRRLRHHLDPKGGLLQCRKLYLA